jgi:DNA-binding response OmpR family regulator
MSDATTKPDRHLALVVDDEATIRLLVSQALQIVGFQVEEVENGPAALAAMENLTPEVILLDARLPGMDGFRVCRSIRQLPNGKAIPVLMITGMDDEELLPRAKEAGASDIIGKPFDLIALGQRVQALVRQQQTESPEGA